MTASVPWRRAKRRREGGEGRSEKSSAAYVGFRARLAAMVAATATATAAALIRVRRYEIIKLGLDGGEGDGMAREYDRRVGRVPGALDVGKRWDAGWRGDAAVGRRDNRIPYTGI